MKSIFEPPALTEMRGSPLHAGSRRRKALGLLALVLLAIGDLFTLMPMILWPALDVLALAVLAGCAVWGMIALGRKVRR